MASPFPFTSGQVLTAAQLNSIGDVTSFTPSWTNFTPGNAVEDWVYVQVNDLVLVRGITVLGSTSSMGTSPYFEIPVGTIKNDQVSVGQTNYKLGSDRYIGLVFSGTTDDLLLRTHLVSGSYIEVTNVNATTPATWTTGDEIRVHAVYSVES